MAAMAQGTWPQKEKTIFLGKCMMLPSDASENGNVSSMQKPKPDVRTQPSVQKEELRTLSSW